nr:hypothetical protein [Micromonospora sp. DSM 115978]
MMTSAAIVLFMTPGLAFFYGGMVRAENVLGMLMQNFACMAVVSVLWVLVTYSIAFGGENAIFGGFEFVGLQHMSEQVPGYTEAAGLAQVVPPIVFATFQLMFAIITPALITGGSADRFRFGAFVGFIGLWSVLVYAPVAHWVFSPTGWLFQHGAEDFAGGTVVHANAGAAAIAVALVLGRRRRRRSLGRAHRHDDAAGRRGAGQVRAACQSHGGPRRTVRHTGCRGGRRRGRVLPDPGGRR